MEAVGHARGGSRDERPWGVSGTVRMRAWGGLAESSIFGQKLTPLPSHHKSRRELGLFLELLSLFNYNIIE